MDDQHSQPQGISHVVNGNTDYHAIERGPFPTFSGNLSPTYSRLGALGVSIRHNMHRGIVVGLFRPIDRVIASNLV